MKSVKNLPENYREILSVDLQKNRRQMLTVNGLALLVMLVMIILGIILRPIDPEQLLDKPTLLLTWLIIIVVGSILYIALHELTHGVFMYAYSKAKVSYGFTGMYAYAGSDVYFAKLPYIVIALAPIVIWGIVLFVLNLTLPSEYFWPVYFIQITNISGAAGDAYVTAKFSTLPADILVRDTGTSMTVYSRAEG